MLNVCGVTQYRNSWDWEIVVLLLITEVVLLLKLSYYQGGPITEGVLKWGLLYTYRRYLGVLLDILTLYSVSGSCAICSSECSFSYLYVSSVSVEVVVTGNNGIHGGH